MAGLSNYSETKLYRRTKYLTFNLILVLVSFVLIFIGSYFVPYLLDQLYHFISGLFSKPVELLDEIYLFISTLSSGTHFAIKVISFFVLFILIRNLFFSGLIGRLIVAIQKLKDAGRFSVGGNARFSGMFEEALNFYRSKGSIYFGRSLYSRSWSIGPISDRHMLTIGGSRSGKGVCCIIPNLLQWRGSVLCIDPKGTNTHVTAERRRRMGQTVHILDPFHITSTETACFNPLDIIDLDSRMVVEDISLIADALIPEEADGKNKHFTDSAKVLVSGYIVHVLTSGDYNNPSLIDVFNIVHSSGEEWVDIHAKMMMNTSCGGLAKKAAERVRKGLDSGEFQSVVATMNTQLHWLASEALTEVLSQSSFSFEDMKNKKTSVYLVIPPDMLKTHGRYLRLFINIAISRYSRGGKAKVPGLFVIDEAPSLGYMKEIAQAYGVMASYNFMLWTFFQDKGQLDKLYGSEAKTFISSSRAVQVFAIEHDDAEWVASMIGTRSMVDIDDLDSASSVMGLRDAASVVNEIGSKLNKSLAKAQYIIRLGQLPMKLDMVPYYESYTLAPLAAKDPDHPWPPLPYRIVKLIFRYVKPPVKWFCYFIILIILPVFIAFWPTVVIGGVISWIFNIKPNLFYYFFPIYIICAYFVFKTSETERNNVVKITNDLFDMD